MKNIFYISIFMACLLAAGCQQKEEPLSFELRLKQALDEKIRQLKDKKYTDCQQELLLLANEIADSTILAMARQLKIMDPIAKPPKPPKPKKPDAIELNDSTAVAPLIKSKKENNITEY